MLTVYDYIVIFFYFVFVGSMGFMFSKINKNSSDYFRGGGAMSWWLAGSSAFISAISCYLFVAFAGRIYRYGTFSLLAVPMSILGYVFTMLFLAKRYRRMRVVTPVEVVRKRFGKGAEQLLAWQRVIIVFVFGGSWLYIMSVFLSPLTNWSVATNILISGILVTIMSVSGGAWAVAASDFVQALLLVIITVIAAFFIYRLPQFSDLSTIYAQLPDRMTDWTVILRKDIIYFMIIPTCLGVIYAITNFMEEGRKYFIVKSDKDAQKAAACVLIGSIVGIFIWYIPIVLSSVVFPDIYNLAPFSALKNPEEGSYVALCISVLPNGMVGMLVCALFAATMSSMDSRLNVTSGIIVKNIYKPLINPNASEENMMFMGKIFTAILGGVCIISGLFFDKLTKLPTNDIYMYMNMYVFTPIVIPVCLSIFIKKTPKWAFYAVIFAGMLWTGLTEIFFNPEAFSIFMGWGGNLSQREMIDVDIGFRGMGLSLIEISIFLLSTLFYKKERDENYKKGVDEFFEDLSTPVIFNAEEHKYTDMFQNKTIGIMSLVYGGFIMLGVFIPNSMVGRLTFIISGLVMLIIGAILYKNYKKIMNGMELNK